MTTTTSFHVAKLQLNDFEVPAIPDGYRLRMVEVAEHHRGRGKLFKAGRTWAEVIERACEHVLHDIGWSRAVITIWLERIADGEEGSMRYDCDSDTWDVTLAD